MTEVVDCLGSITAHIPAFALTAERWWSPTREPVLYEHALGHVGYPRSEDVWLRDRAGWLPTLPLTFLLEAAAQAAQRLFPGHLVVGFRSMKSRAYVVLSDLRDTLVRLDARSLSSAGSAVAIEVTLPEAEDIQGPAFQVVVEMAVDPEKSVKASPLPALVYPQPSPSTPQEIYDEVLFHGPSFHRIHAVSAMGENGIDAEVILDSESRGRCVDPQLLDVVSQMMNYWAHERIDTRSWGALFAADSIRWLRPMFARAGKCFVRVRVERLSSDLLRAQAELLDELSSSPWMQWSGVLNLWRPAPRQILPLVRQPWDAWAAEEIPLPDLQASLFVARVFEGESNNAHRFLVEQMVLHPQERTVGIGRTPSGLVERVVAKDAVRTYLRRRTGHRYALYEISLQEDAVSSEWSRLSSEVLLQVRSTSEFAVAVLLPRSIVSRDIGIGFSPTEEEAAHLAREQLGVEGPNVSISTVQWHDVNVALAYLKRQGTSCL